jgi:hypothetical protein
MEAVALRQRNKLSNHKCLVSIPFLIPRKTLRVTNNYPNPKKRSDKMSVRSIFRASLLTLSAGLFAVSMCMSQATAADDSPLKANETATTEKKTDENTGDEKNTADKSDGEKKAVEPAHQVIACYFHRTNRCPTCRKIGSYIIESVNTEFTAQIKDKSVKVMEIDFQDAKNEKFTKAYKISGPTLVIMNVSDGKVKTWKTAPKVWSLVSKKDDFSKYVSEEVKSYLKEEKSASRNKSEDTNEKK